MATKKLNPRVLKKLQGHFAPIPEDKTPVDDSTLVTQLTKWAQEHHLTCALAHADDGVIWGWFDTAWHWSGEVFSEYSPELHLDTLQQIRVFGAEAEVFLWRTAQGLNGRIATDLACDEECCFDEPQLLWGTDTEESKGGFRLMREGAQGLRHAPPQRLMQGEGERIQLHVRSYFKYDSDGCVKVIGSRLVS